MDNGFEVHLANTMAIQQYEGLKHTNDHTDARFLAHLMRLGILPEGHIYPRSRRGVRDLLRRRLLMMKHRTAQYLSLQSLIARHTGRQLNAKGVKEIDEAGLHELFDDEATCVGASVTRRQLESLNRAVKEIEDYVQGHCRDQVDYELVTSVPGIGVILGQTIMLETGSIGRFPGPGNYASYARCVKSERLSNAKRKGQGNRKNGNRYLGMAFMEAAHYGAIWNPRLKRFYQRKCAKSPVMVAKKALANKLARAVYHMLKHQQPFDITRAFA